MSTETTIVDLAGRPSLPSISVRRIAFACVQLTVALFWVHPFVPTFGLGLALALLSAGFRKSPFPLAAIVGFVVILFYVVAILPSLVFYDPLRVSYRMIVTPLLAGATFFLLRPTAPEVDRILKILAVSSALAALLMYIQTGPMSVTFNPVDLLARYRGDGFWLGNRFYPGAPVIGGPAAIAVLSGSYALLHTKGLVRFFFAITALLAFVIILLSVARGALVAAGVASMLLFASPRRMLIPALLVVPSFFVFQLAAESIPTASARYATMLDLARDRSMLGRFRLWEEAYHMAMKRTTGAGFSFKMGGLTSHNEILGHWLSSGIVGLVAYLLLLGWWFLTGLVSPPSVPSLQFLSLFSLQGLVEFYSVSSGSLYYPVFWFVCPLMLMVASSRRV